MHYIEMHRRPAYLMHPPPSRGGDLELEGGVNESLWTEKATIAHYTSIPSLFMTGISKDQELVTYLKLYACA